MVYTLYLTNLCDCVLLGTSLADMLRNRSSQQQQQQSDSVPSWFAPKSNDKSYRSPWSDTAKRNQHVSLPHPNLDMILPLVTVALGVVLDITGYDLAIMSGHSVPLRLLALPLVMLGSVLTKTTMDSLPATPNADLVSSGPYSFTRNPFCVGVNCVVLGMGCLMNSVWMCLFGSLLLPIIQFLCIIRREEKVLHSRFGVRYEAYFDDTPRWFL